MAMSNDFLKHLNRRSFIRGAGGVLLPLPFLGSLRPKIAGAAEGTVPLRLVVFVSKFGVYETNWSETTIEPTTPIDGNPQARSMLMTDFGDRWINPTLRNDFKPFYNKMNFIRGLDVLWQDFPRHNTGVPLCASSKNPSTTEVAMLPQPSGGTSIDVLLERIYDQVPKKKCIRIAPLLDSGHNLTRWLPMSFRNSVAINHEKSVLGLYDALFGDLTIGISGAPDTAKTRRLGMINAALPQVNQLISSGKLSASDKGTLDLYLERLNALRQTINERQSATCRKPTELNPYKTESEYKTYGNSLSIYQDINQIITNAFTCDMTRLAVVNIMHGSTSPGFHDMHPNSHYDMSQDWRASGLSATDIATRKAAQKKYDDIDLGYYQEQAKYVLDLLTRMDSIPEGDGTMLDNTLILWTNEIGGGNDHHMNDLPVLVAGGGAGKINAGQYLDYQQRPKFYMSGTSKKHAIGRPYSHLLTDIMRCFGLTEADWELSGKGNGYGEFGTKCNETKRTNGRYESFYSNRNVGLPGFLKV